MGYISPQDPPAWSKYLAIKKCQTIAEQRETFLSNFLARTWRRIVNGLGLNDPKAWDPMLWNLYGSRDHAGEHVDEQSALTYSAFWCAVRLISETAAALPLHLCQTAGRGKRKALDRYAYHVLHTAANQYMTAMQCRETMIAHVLTWGNCYAEIIRNELGELTALWPITPDRVKVEMTGGELTYRIRVSGAEDVILPRSKVLHVAGLGFDGFMGYSVVAMARKSLGLSMALETFGANYFANGTHPGVIVSHPGQLNEQAHQRLKVALVDAYSGLGNSHRLMLLEDGMKLEKLGIPPNDSQFLESRAFQVPEVARWFNLPPHKLRDLTKSSFSNIESEQISFVQDAILPWLVRLEQSFNQQLLSDADRRRGFYYKHVVEGLLRGDTKSRGEFYSSLLDRGVFSINDVRELEDRDPVEGGDVHLVPLNMTTLENAGKVTDQANNPARLPAPNK
jgi:HK97 family phage portal protein